MTTRLRALSIAGHDPTGGAGITADIITFASFGIHTATAITANTVQTSARCQRWQPVDLQLVDQQLTSLLAHSTFNVIKIGMIGSIAMANLISKHLSELRKNVPIVLDPVLASEEQDSLSEHSLPSFIAEELLPLCTIATPNTREFEQLQHHFDSNVNPCKWTLVTGTHELEGRPYIEHKLLNKANEEPTVFQSKRLPSTFHGSGCTLASAIASGLAHGHSVPKAVDHALIWTHRSLLNAYSIDSEHIAVPNRFG